jgi:hypothetical protein
MKVMDLRCAHGHTFEGWFASDEEWQRQAGTGLLACPLCGNAEVQRLPSAPHLNLGAKPAVAASSTQGSAATAAPTAEVVTLKDPPRDPSPGAQQQPSAQLQTLWLQAVQHIMAHTQDVGDRFPEEARRIHYGEEPHRPIRGQASRDDVASLLDEGIELMSLPIPAALKGPVQ